MKKISSYLLIALLAISCNEKNVTQKEWFLSYEDEGFNISKFSKLEIFDESGDLSYDSTIYPNDYGFGVNHYQNNKLTYEYSEIEPKIIIEKSYEYSGDELMKAITYTNGDTIISHYVIDKKDELGNPIKISTFNSVGEFLGYEQRIYQEKMLQSIMIFLKEDTTEELISERKVFYNESQLIEYEVILDKINSVKDSLAHDYENNKKIRTVLFTKQIDMPDYLLIEEKHFYWSDNTIDKITSYDYLNNLEYIYNAEIKWQ
ncbi:hypothetical protein QYS48_28025 [Marivirga arenosa]|uniref:Uncharacterized protein n=1 Tax=Marivirga arenosa TaxID=3059076 RepID=A0AA51N6V4_9BACT|nr:hypothetical protein [Marivirga sp. ABR2-2]WMN07173.1 hypothetical protein QYS48_28025 [Marivirga sp. ABR2-2]